MNGRTLAPLAAATPRCQRGSASSARAATPLNGGEEYSPRGAHGASTCAAATTGKRVDPFCFCRTRAAPTAHGKPTLPAAHAFVEPCSRRASRARRGSSASTLRRNRVPTCSDRCWHQEGPPKRSPWRAAAEQSRLSATARPDAAVRWEYQQECPRRYANECAPPWQPREEPSPRSETRGDRGRRRHLRETPAWGHRGGVRTDPGERVLHGSSQARDRRSSQQAIRVHSTEFRALWRNQPRGRCNREGAQPARAGPLRRDRPPQGRQQRRHRAHAARALPQHA
ncbi:uncharacterized protein SOCE26_092060 [Sorangium cellulosum]|uniref:Uncharacterized protein n=1 Tax=Sorangium cellulosum TaxID=56 RepID=A0A2L0F835_SORCE|nr:uncharacterized protein SOCE26_092060 [Sorangium cellulosum]